MEAQDSLNKYGRVKEAFVFNATEDSIKENQLATPKNRFKSPKKKLKNERSLFLIPALVILPLVTGALIWTTFTGNSDTKHEFVRLAGTSQVKGEKVPDSDEKAWIVLDVEKIQRNEKSQELPNEGSDSPSGLSTDLKLVSVKTPIKKSAEKLTAKMASFEVEQKPVAVNTTFAWIVYSAMNVEEAKLQAKEFSEQGAEVILVPSQTPKGDRVRLAWANTFPNYDSAKKATLPSVFSKGSWVYQIN